jgi:deoxyribodipyrimidine photo-lyase
MRALVWFRSDLRTLDNAALFHAAKASDGGVVALFVVSPGQWKQHDYAPAKVDLMLRTLAELSHALGQYNIALKVRVADRIADVPGVVAQTMKEFGCDTLHYNKEYELDEVRRDEKTAALIQKAGGKVFAHSDQCLIEPGDVRTGEGKFFTVYSPFKRASYKLLSSQGGVKEFPVPRKQHGMVSTPDAVPAVVEGFESSVDPKFWPGGEKHALSQLRTFAEKHVEPYKAQRDFPGIRGTSMLSPYLTIGAISPRQCIVAAVQANTHARKNNTSPFDSGPEGITHWISEVLWRDFYIHILVGFPRVCMHRAFQPATEAIAWNENPKHLDAWKHGRTGVPIVDAGMRQLQQMGWMHNRVRMIVAMYFTKNLFLDWHVGEKFFMQHLVDGFLASNNGGWQWSASTGTDAAPYFRIFNPISQSQKFDADGTYIKHFVPELREVEGDAIHEPWTIPGLLRSRLDYPQPLVDLSKTRERAIEAFREIKGVSAS